MIPFSPSINRIARLSPFTLIVVMLVSTLQVQALEAPEQAHNHVKTVGKWIKNKQGSVVKNPQTSGLTFMGDRLYTVSDASANKDQRKMLHEIDIANGQMIEDPTLNNTLILGARLQHSCFANYLNDKPDYEAVVALPSASNTPPQWLLVTEDGSRGTEISGKCLKNYESNSNFTRYPALLVRVALIDQQLTVNGVRAIRFEDGTGTDKKGLIEKVTKEKNNKWKAKRIGNSQENDGIEGLAFTKDMELLLGIEEDGNELPRVFKLQYSDDIFDVVDTKDTDASFIIVQDSGFELPKVARNNSPINGLGIYYPSQDSQGFLIAAARNTDRLWIIDLKKKKTIQILDVEFHTPAAGCNDGKTHRMKRVAIEGVAVKDKTIFLVNDPWREKYEENRGCESDMAAYKANAALLFEIPIDDAWFVQNAGPSN
jgi:hypothetical protein